MPSWFRIVPPSRARFGVPVRVAVAVLAAGLVAGGIWVAGAVVTDDATVAMAATAGWIGLAVVLAVLAGQRWRALALPVVGAVLVTSAGIGGGLLRVYLAVGPAGPVRGGLDLGRLRGNRGTQQYEIPAGVDLRRYGAVVIWCRAFTVAFGTAALVPPG